MQLWRLRGPAFVSFGSNCSRLNALPRLSSLALLCLMALLKYLWTTHIILYSASLHSDSNLVYDVPPSPLPLLPATSSAPAPSSAPPQAASLAPSSIPPASSERAAMSPTPGHISSVWPSDSASNDLQVKFHVAKKYLHISFHPP